MQIYKISQPMFVSRPNNVLKVQTASVAMNSGNGMNIPDNYGRVMVNFKGANQLLRKQDETLLKTLGETLHLSEERANILKQEFLNFLKENNLNSLIEAKFGTDDEGFFDECEFIGKLKQRISDKLNLNEQEDTAVIYELTKISDEKENYVAGGKKYIQSMLDLEDFLRLNSEDIFSNK